MKKTVSITMYLTLLISISLLLAIPGYSASNAELEERIKVLEEQANPDENKWFDMITLSGAVEVETVFEDSELDGDSSDISLATVEIGIEATYWNGSPVLC